MTGRRAVWLSEKYSLKETLQLLEKLQGSSENQISATRAEGHWLPSEDKGYLWLQLSVTHDGLLLSRAVAAPRWSNGYVPTEWLHGQRWEDPKTIPVLQTGGFPDHLSLWPSQQLRCIVGGVLAEGALLSAGAQNPGMFTMEDIIKAQIQFFSP